jgi:hypothetical protein
MHYKRNGEIKKAREYLERALRIERHAGLEVNLGNLDFIEREGMAAFQRYKRVLNRAEAQPAVYYNLGQLLRHGKDTDILQQGSTYRAAAMMGIGGWRVENFNKISRLQINRYLLDVPFPRERYARWVYTLQESPLASALWERFSRWIPYEFALYTGGLALLLWLLLPLANLFRRGEVCKKCGVINLLEQLKEQVALEVPANSILCGRCIHSFAGQDEGAPRRRVHKELLAGRYQRRQARIEMFLSLLTLGGGHTLQGRSLKGFLFFALGSVYAVMWWFSLSSWPSTTGLEAEASWLPLIFGGILLGMVWLYALRDVQRYTRQG